MNGKHKKQKRMIAPAVLGAVDLPPEACGRIPYITVTGDRYMKVEQHRGILQVTAECVRLYSEVGIIRICGSRLLVSDMDNESISLSGCIKSVGFE